MAVTAVGVEGSVGAVACSDACCTNAANDPFELLELAIIDDEEWWVRPAASRTVQEEIADIDRQRSGHPRQNIEPDVDLAAFDLTDMFAAVADQFGKLLLAQPARPPQPLHVAADAEPGCSQVIWHAWRLFDTRAGAATSYR